MFTFTYTTEDQRRIDGLTSAREQANADNAINPELPQFATNEEYMQFVLDRATESYARQYGHWE